MSGTRALVSSWTAGQDDAFREDHLKLCFLWYDEILVEPLGQFDASKFIDELLEGETSRSITHAVSDVIRPLDEELRKEITGGLREEASRGYPRWGDNLENYTYPDPESATQFAHNELLAAIANEKGVDRFTDGYRFSSPKGGPA